MTTWWSADAPFIKLFGPTHLAYIGIMLACLAVLLVCRRHIRAHPDAWRWGFFALSLAQLTTLYSWYALETGFDMAEALPLHISRVSTILGLVFLATRSLKLLDVAFYLGLFAYLTFLLPQRIYGIDHVIGWSFLISHIVTILLPIFAGIAFGWRPSRSGLWRAFGWFLLYFGLVLVVNPLVDGNYFYLRDRPLLKDLPTLLYDSLAVLATFAIFWIGYAVSRLLPEPNHEILPAPHHQLARETVPNPAD